MYVLCMQTVVVTLYLLVYKLTFYDRKITLDLYTSHTQRCDQKIQDFSITIMPEVH